MAMATDSLTNLIGNTYRNAISRVPTKRQNLKKELFELFTAVIEGADVIHKEKEVKATLNVLRERINHLMSRDHGQGRRFHPWIFRRWGGSRLYKAMMAAHQRVQHLQDDFSQTIHDAIPPVLKEIETLKAYCMTADDIATHREELTDEFVEMTLVLNNIDDIAEALHADRQSEIKALEELRRYEIEHEGNEALIAAKRKQMDSERHECDFTVKFAQQLKQIREAFVLSKSSYQQMREQFLEILDQAGSKPVEDHGITLFRHIPLQKTESPSASFKRTIAEENLQRIDDLQDIIDDVLAESEDERLAKAWELYTDLYTKINQLGDPGSLSSPQHIDDLFRGEKSVWDFEIRELMVNKLLNYCFRHENLHQAARDGSKILAALYLGKPPLPNEGDIRNDVVNYYDLKEEVYRLRRQTYGYRVSGEQLENKELKLRAYDTHSTMHKNLAKMFAYQMMVRFELEQSAPGFKYSDSMKISSETVMYGHSQSVGSFRREVQSFFNERLDNDVYSYNDFSAIYHNIIKPTVPDEMTKSEEGYAYIVDGCLNQTGLNGLRGHFDNVVEYVKASEQPTEYSEVFHDDAVPKMEKEHLPWLLEKFISLIRSMVNRWFPRNREVDLNYQYDELSRINTVLIKDFGQTVNLPEVRPTTLKS